MFMFTKQIHLWSYLSAVLLAIVLTACAHRIKYSDYQNEPDPRRKPYVLGVADRIRIGVWQNQDLSTDALIRPDGTITLPLLGDITAAGHTTEDLRQIIIHGLNSYFKGTVPTVTIAVLEVGSYRITVSGNVFQPGAFAPGRYVTIMEVIAIAGGFTRYAKTKEIIINRTDERGVVRRIPVDYEAIAAGTAPEQNLVLLPGDTVYIP